MATYRGQGASSYDVGQAPPYVSWTFVKGDTASFKVYVTDDLKQPLNIPDWTIKMEIKRPNAPVVPGVITDNAQPILTIVPAADPDDLPGEFTVVATSSETSILRTNDIFDIELSQPQLVWTVAQGKLIVLEDVTN
jgi:hypothetical protein